MENTAYTTWYDGWLNRINGWTMDCGVAQTARVLTTMPDLVSLLVKLSEDTRLPAEVREQASKTGAGVMRGIEFLPANFSGVVGIVEDAVTIAKALKPLLWQIDPAILKEHWTGEGDPAAFILYLVEDREDFAPRC